MNEIVESIKDRIIRTCGEHPGWTAKQVADHLGIERHHVYNHARAANIKLAAAPPPFAKAAEALPVEAPKLPAVVQPKPTDVVDLTFFATKPEEMAQAQIDMLAWCRQKVAAVAVELAEAGENHDTAVRNGWATGNFERAVDRARKSLIFYEKVEAAIAAGYYIVPPFPLDVFTIRTNRKKPDRKTSTSRWDQHLQMAQLLPAGEGRYVSNRPQVYSITIPAADAGAVKDVEQYEARDFLDVGFPFALAKPEIVKATEAAMALKIFDQLGVLPARRSPDPIICGQILKPNRDPVTFFVAWWLDTRTL